MSEEIIAGRVLRGVVGAATLEVGAERIERAIGTEITVRVGDDDVRIRIDPSIIVPHTISGAWAELAQHRLAQLFADAPPGDDVHVRIVGGAVGPGDAVAVRVRGTGEPHGAVRVIDGADVKDALAALARVEAEVHERQLETDASAARKAQRVAAREEHRRVAPHPPWDRSTFVLVVLAAGMLGLGAHGASEWRGVIPRDAGAGSVWVGGLGLLGAALIAWSTRHDLAVVHYVRYQPATSKRQLVWCLQIFATLLAMAGAYGRQTNPQPVEGLVIACLLPMATAVIAGVRAFLGARSLRRVAAAPRLEVPPPPRTWGVIEGTIRGGKGALVSATTTRRVQQRGRGRSTYVWEELVVESSAAPSFKLDAGEWRAKVFTKDMTWSAPATWRPREERGATRAVAALRDGDRVLVLVRTGGAGETDLRAGGPQSLVVVRTPLHPYLGRAWRPTLVIIAYVAIVLTAAYLAR